MRALLLASCATLPLAAFAQTTAPAPLKVGPLPYSMLGLPNGPAALNGSGQVPAAQLPAATQSTPGTVPSLDGVGGAASHEDRRFGDSVNIAQLGADPTGAAYADAALNQAVATGKTILVPTGSFRLAHMLLLAPGQHLVCMGRQVSHLMVDSTFDPAAIAVVQVQSNSGEDLCDTYFAQPQAPITTSAVAAGASNQVAVANTTGVTVGMAVFDTTNPAAVQSGIVVSAMNGNTLSLSGIASASAIASGDGLGFSTTRALMKTLAQGCTTGTGGTGCMYPPAIFGQDAQDVQIKGIRTTAAWDGINLAGNAAAFVIDDAQIGALDVGLQFNGAQDFCKVTNYHFWPFGLTSPGLLGIYRDGNTFAAQIGRCDAPVFANFQSYQGRVLITAAANYVQFANLMLDYDHANLEVAGLNPSATGGTFNQGTVVEVNGLYGAKSGSHTDHAINVTGGRLSVSNYALLDGSPNAAPIYVGASGALSMTNGEVDLNTYTAPAAQVDGGRLNLAGMRLHPYPGAHTSPLVLQNAGVLTMRTSTIDDLGASAGNGVVLASDNPDNYVAGNSLGGWGFVKPGTIATTPPGGVYGPNGSDVTGFAPTPTFATPGSFAIASYGVQTGKVWMQEAGYRFDVSVQFTTPSLAGAAGAFYIPLSVASAAHSFAPMTLAGTNGIKLDSGYTQLAAQFDPVHNAIELFESGPNAPTQPLMPANFTAGSTVTLAVTGTLTP